MGTAKKITSEDVWESIKELTEAQKETDRQLKETDRQLKKTAEQLEESKLETDRQLKETAEQLKESNLETDRQLKEIGARFDSQWGKLMESLVDGDIVKLFTERGIPVEESSQRVSKPFEGTRYEFDIVVHNGDETIVVEVKTTLNVKKVDHFLANLKLFKKIFPKYKDNKVYGAVAYLVADSSSEKYAENKKLFVIKATGSSASIVNEKSFRPRAF